MDRRGFLSGLVLLLRRVRDRAREITVGSKNFTEQLVLGELLAQYLESDLPHARRGRFYLAGTYICQQALLAGRIDMYVEYTGTALAAILKQTASGDSQAVYEQVKSEYRSRFDLDVMPPLGFNNSFAMVMRGDDARRLGVSTLSQLARVAPRDAAGRGLRIPRTAGRLQGTGQHLWIEVRRSAARDGLGLLYRALQNKSVDMVAGNNTDGLIAALGLVVLEDDKHYFPPYDAVPIVRPQLFQECPQAQAAFEKLAGRITADDMRKMNYAVDGEKKDAAAVAREFLVSNRLLAS